MKINELEKELNISRANIRFYEKEGLLNPIRKDNGYRDYKDEDISRLKLIIIFRLCFAFLVKTDFPFYLMKKNQP